MRTNIEIDNKLMEEAIEYSGKKTKKEIIHNALKSYVEYQKRLTILSLEGKGTWEGNLEEMRTYDKWENSGY